MSASDEGASDVPIICACTAVEVFFSELPDVIERRAEADERLLALASALVELEAERAQVLLKYRVAYFMLTSRRPERGADPFQSYATLVRLRNDIVHFKPVTGDDPRELDDDALVRFFTSRGIIGGAEREGRVTWDRAVLCPPVARWACDTAVATLGHFIALLPAGTVRSELERCWLSAASVPSRGA